jgi:hypothetical protein
MPQDLDQVTLAAAKDEEFASEGIAAERLLHLQGKAVACHMSNLGSGPGAHR